MSLFTDSYVAYQLGKAAADRRAAKMQDTAERAALAYQHMNMVKNLRTQIYDIKRDIAATDTTVNLLNCILKQDEKNPPDEIFICSSFVAIRSKMSSGEIVFETDGELAYQCMAAFALIFQDMYPEVYAINKVSVDVLVQHLNDDTWYVTLTKRGKYCGQSLTPTFAVNDLKEKQLSELPLVFEDPYKKQKKKFVTLSFVFAGVAVLLAILCVLLEIPPVLSIMSAIAGIVFSIIGIMKTSKICIIGMIVNISLAFYSFVIGIMQLLGII